MQLPVQACSDAAAGSNLGAMIDPKAYGRQRNFSGADEEWDGWASVARSHLSLRTDDAEHWIDVAENAPGGAVSVHMAALNAEAREFSRVL